MDDWRDCKTSRKDRRGGSIGAGSDMVRAAGGQQSDHIPGSSRGAGSSMSIPTKGFPSLIVFDAAAALAAGQIACVARVRPGQDFARNT